MEYSNFNEDHGLAQSMEPVKNLNLLKNKYNKKCPAKTSRAIPAKPYKTQTKLMRETFPAQWSIGQIDIADIKIDVRSRVNIPLTPSLGLS